MQLTPTFNAVAVYLDGALNRVDRAVFLVDAELRLLHANAAAAELLERDTALRLHGEKLLQDSWSGDRTLAQLVAAALDGHHSAHLPQALSLPRQSRPPLLLTVAPFVPPEGTSAVLSPCVIVMVSDPDAHQLSCPVLMQLFDLTPAEAGVARALAHGQALEDIAQALDISMHTVKTHLQKLFRKTGTRRQGELVAMLHGVPTQSFE